MKECDKRKSHISSKLRMIYISSNNFGHPVTKIFTTLYYTSLKYTSLHFTTLSTLHFLSFKLHPSTLHYSLIWLNSIYIYHLSISPYITTLHLTSLHCTLDDFRHTSFRFTPFIIAFLPVFLKILRLQWKVPNASAGSWFQFLMVLFTDAYFPISMLCILSLIFRT